MPTLPGGSAASTADAGLASVTPGFPYRATQTGPSPVTVARSSLMGPHPAVAAARLAVHRALAEVDGPVVVACSGGADSLALAAATAFVRPGCALITVDHGLQDGSAQQAERVASLAYELGFDPVTIVRVHVGTRGGPEAAARTARYAALEATAATVLLGHTLDDQAETVLLGLGRGSGPRSIAGMRPVDGRYRRPFLGLRRTTTEAVCAELGLTPWADPHNDDPTYRRVRIRREVLPLLEHVLAGGVAEALARTAALIQDDLDALDAQIPAELPRAIRTRTLKRWAEQHGAGPLTQLHVRELDRLVTDWHGQGPVDLPGGQRVSRSSGRLTITPPPQE